MRTILAIDPSIDSIGFAYFAEHGGWWELLSAWHYKTKGKTDAERLSSIAHPQGFYDDLVVERPLIYSNKGRRGRKRRGPRPNDIIKLALSAGAAIGGIDHWQLFLYKAIEWKGGPVDKQVQNNRTERDLQKLGWLDRCELPSSKRGRGDVLDAAGIGLYHMHEEYGDPGTNRAI